ncbi:MAG: hypothetical protein NC299_12180 [Lachnospiraceae bacterium]|nr:hypothetical protein [Ruminococcus sp.]MCM1276099.1 hypothetical protein [Lachnospiraceae bacterium]
MDDKVILAAAVSGGLMLIVFIGVIIFVCTYHTGIYKGFKKPVKTMGLIDEAQYIRDSNDGEGYYLITYSYTDNVGLRHTGTFKWLQNAGRTGDKIAVHYDSQNPEKSIADCQLKYGKSLWWKVLIALAVIIVPAVVVVMLFGEK